jgi:hypothetical protein
VQNKRINSVATEKEGGSSFKLSSKDLDTGNEFIIYAIISAKILIWLLRFK